MRLLIVDGSNIAMRASLGGDIHPDQSTGTATGIIERCAREYEATHLVVALDSPTGMPSWLIGVLVGAGILAIILLILLFTRGTSTPPAPAPAPKVEAPVPTPVPAPAAPAVAPSQPATPAPAPPAEANLKQGLRCHD